MPALLKIALLYALHVLNTMCLRCEKANFAPRLFPQNKHQAIMPFGLKTTTCYADSNMVVWASAYACRH